MIEIVSTILAIVASLTLIFVFVGFVVVWLASWFRERSLPPEEKERRSRQLWYGSGEINQKQARNWRYAYGFMVFAYLFVLGSIVVSSWQGAQERQAEVAQQPQQQEQSARGNQRSESEVDTSAWQTYRNDGLGYSLEEGRGFELKYPRYFNKDFIEGSTLEYFEVHGERPEMLRVQVHLQNLNGFEYANPPGAFSFRYNADTKTWKSSEESVPQDFAPKVRMTEKGFPYYYVEMGDAAGRADKAFIAHPKENIVIEIIVSRNESYRDCIKPCPEEEPFSKEETIHEIVSTLRFIESINTSTWQTYRNDEFRFEVQIPQDWVVVDQVKEYDYIALDNIETNNQYYAGDITIEIKPADIYQDQYDYYGVLNLKDYLKAAEHITFIGTKAFGGQEGYEAWIGGYSLSYGVYVERLDGRIYIISLPDKFKEEDLTTLENKILSTFRFVE